MLNANYPQVDTFNLDVGTSNTLLGPSSYGKTFLVERNDVGGL